MLRGYIYLCVTLNNKKTPKLLQEESEENFFNREPGRLSKEKLLFPCYDSTITDLDAYLSKNDRKSAKEGKNLSESGHVSDVEYNNISDCMKFCYVRGKVVPQTSENREERKTFVTFLR